jgi:rhomboid protease GluP
VVTWVLLGANALVWAGVNASGGADNPQALLDFGAIFGPLIADGQYWRLFTAMFLHAEVAHLGMNGIGLLIFGQLVENFYGHARFLIIYVVAGLFGSVASYMFNTVAIGLGASGAIFGVVGALAAFFLVQRRTMGEIALRNLIGVSVLVAISLGYGLITPQVDNWAHLGGLASGFALGLALSPRYRTAMATMGFQTRLLGTTSLVGKWWVLPVATTLLVAGVWVGSAKVPESAYSHVGRAEDFYEEGDLDRALAEVEQAIGIEQSTARARYLRALIYLDRGNAQDAIAELTAAIRFGQINDPNTMRKAISLLVSVRGR